MGISTLFPAHSHYIKSNTFYIVLYWMKSDTLYIVLDEVKHILFCAIYTHSILCNTGWSQKHSILCYKSKTFYIVLYCVLQIHICIVQIHIGIFVAYIHILYCAILDEVKHILYCATSQTHSILCYKSNTFYIVLQVKHILYCATSQTHSILCYKSNTFYIVLYCVLQIHICIVQIHIGTFVAYWQRFKSNTMYIVYRVAKTHRIPYLHRSFSAKETYI